MLKSISGNSQPNNETGKPLSRGRPNGNGFNQNTLLRSLAFEERIRIAPAMQHVQLGPGQVVYEAGSHIEYVYFPTTCLLSSVFTTHDGATAQIALIGAEGVAGLELFLMRRTSAHCIIAQIAGDCIRAAAPNLFTEFTAAGALQRSVLHYTYRLLTQLSQTAICNRLHKVEQRLCRLLLECHDRTEGNEIQMTQENIADMLGVRREGVTVAAGRLQEAGYIQYSRGHLRILNRQGLQELVCECYHHLARELDDSKGTQRVS